MASPVGPLPHPPTPPADPPAPPAYSNPSRQQQSSTTAMASSAMQTNQPNTSTTDLGTSKRPRDARLIHMLLANLGVSAYQERVPLQLMDFSYRYTSSILQDAQHLSVEGYTGIAPDGTVTGVTHAKGAGADFGGVNISALRLAIGSRLQYQFQPGLPKEVLTEIANERNGQRVPGAGVGLAKAPGPELAGVRLPVEKFVLSGRGWGIKDLWESEGEEDVEEDGQGEGKGENGEGMDVEEDGDGDDERMEDIFGVDGVAHEDEGGREEGDEEMGDG